jgi:hypothetical protein
MESLQASTPEGDERSGNWLRWQARPGYMTEIVKTRVQLVTGNVLDEAAVNQTVQVVGHLAELRLNYQLTVK